MTRGESIQPEHEEERKYFLEEIQAEREVMEQREKDLLAVWHRLKESLEEFKEMMDADPDIKATQDGKERQEIYEIKYQIRASEHYKKIRQAREEFRQALEKHNVQMEHMMQGIVLPTGEYKGKVIFEHRSGKKEIQELLGFQTFQNTSMTDVVDRVLGDISMQGLHNFGCRFNDEGLSLVSFSLYEKEGEKKKIWTTSCWIDRGGHLVRGRQNEGFWF